jgi:hypothetical protein
LSPAKRREADEHVRQVLGPDRVSQRRAGRVLGQPRSTQRRTPAVPLLGLPLVNLKSNWWVRS